jgi:hypothetical protein
MAFSDAIRWFKTTFAAQIRAQTKNTPFTISRLAAIAMQESYGDSWKFTYEDKSLQVLDVLRLCVGDTQDSPPRDPKAFPNNRQALEAYTAADGKKMFQIARETLGDLCKFSPVYRAAIENPDKFAHAFGMFQYDIQYFSLGDADYFLSQKWGDFDQTLGKCLKELNDSMAYLYRGQRTLTDDEFTYVAIGYNKGPKNVIKGGGYEQGYPGDNGHRYGWWINQFLTIANKIPDPTPIDALSAAFQSARSTAVARLRAVPVRSAASLAR